MLPTETSDSTNVPLRSEDSITGHMHGAKHPFLKVLVCSRRYRVGRSRGWESAGSVAVASTAAAMIGRCLMSFPPYAEESLLPNGVRHHFLRDKQKAARVFRPEPPVVAAGFYPRAALRLRVFRNALASAGGATEWSKRMAFTLTFASSSCLSF